MYQEIGVEPPALRGSGLRVAVVVSRFNWGVSKGLYDVCLSKLEELEVGHQVHCLTVPGALELPLALQLLFTGGQEKVDVAIALGCIIRGETYHFDIVSNEMARGIMDVQIKHNVPIVNMVLTVETEDQALQRVEQKGRDAACVAVEMGLLRKELLNG